MDATSSLERDIAAGHQSELDTFSGALIRLARQYGVPVPMSEKCYRGVGVGAPIRAPQAAV